MLEYIEELVALQLIVWNSGYYFVSTDAFMNYMSAWIENLFKE